MTVWTATPGAALVGNLTPLASVGPTAALLYARRYNGYFGSNVGVLLGTPTASPGPRAITDAGGLPDYSSLGWTGYIHAPAGGTFSAAPGEPDDGAAMWVGRVTARTPTLSNHFAGWSNLVGGGVIGRSGSVVLRPGYTPVRVAYGQMDGAYQAPWTVTFPPGASFVHATATLGF